MKCRSYGCSDPVSYFYVDNGKVCGFCGYCEFEPEHYPERFDWRKLTEEESEILEVIYG